MFQIVLIIAVLVIFVLYLKPRREVKVPGDDLALRCQFYEQQVVSFLRRLKQSRSKTRIHRLESEIERIQKLMDLDELLEKAEKESNPNRAIDFYLEALSYIMKNSFEKEHRADIEDKIKSLQQTGGKEVLR